MWVLFAKRGGEVESCAFEHCTALTFLSLSMLPLHYVHHILVPFITDSFKFVLFSPRNPNPQNIRLATLIICLQILCSFFFFNNFIQL